jgi:hypothetical protein
MWKGIVLGNVANIITLNGTKIEDAEKAISAEGTASNYLNITKTTFNRNDIGISLESTLGATNGPNIIVFSRNKFTCTAPLNGTTDQIGFAGIKTVNVPVTVNPVSEAYNNRFEGLQNGIVAEGGNTLISGRFFRFYDIKRDGIFIEEGSLTLRQSFFRNCEENGVNIILAHNVDIRGGSFTINSDIPSSNPSITHHGVYIDGFALNSSVNFNSGFFAGIGTDERVEGIYLRGGNVGAGTRITVFQSTFNIFARGNAIHMRGAFPATSETHIFGNSFSCSNPVSSTIVYGVNAENDGKNNLNIYGNRFTNFPGGAYGHGIALENAIGTGNYIGDNNWNASGGSFLTSFNSQNFTICSNTSQSLGASSGFGFFGTNTGIDFTENKIYATGVGVKLYPSALIGPQSHKGNEWHPVIVQLPSFNITFRAAIHAQCETPSLAPQSKFTVHTDQSVWNDNTNSYDFFSEFYPENIEPSDPMFDFFEKQSGTPPSGCSTQLTGPGGDDQLERGIADEAISIPTENPVMDWYLKSYLYRKLVEDPVFAGSYAPYSTFLDNNASTNVGRFYAVEKKMEEAVTAGDNLDQQSRAIMDNIASLVSGLEHTDSLLESALDEGELENLAQIKSGQIGQLKGLQSDYDALYSDYKSDIQTKLQEAYTLLQQIAPAMGLETHLFEVRNIQLQSALYQNGGFTQVQLADLKDIGQLCSETAGPAVSIALGLLPDCEKQGIVTCEPEPVDDTAPQSYETPGGQGLLAPPSSNGAPSWLYPNPTTSSFFVKMPQKGEVAIFDMTGKTLSVQRVEEPDTPVEISQRLAPGIYLVRMRTDDGTTVTEKLSVQTN